MNQIIPGILEKDWDSIEAKLNKILTFTNTAHIDIIDGKFVNNKTFLDPEPFYQFSERIFLEVHLMVEEPVEYVEAFAKNGFRRFIGHIEKMSHQVEFIDVASKYGEVAFALDGPTHINSIKVPLEQLDSILIYTSNQVGFSGPPMMDDRLDKIRHLKKLTNMPIEVDGGVKDASISRAKAAGASRFVATSFIWDSANPAEKFHILKDLLT